MRMDQRQQIGGDLFIPIAGAGHRIQITIDQLVSAVARSLVVQIGIWRQTRQGLGVLAAIMADYSIGVAYFPDRALGLERRRRARIEIIAQQLFRGIGTALREGR